ncbi:MAG TPA: ABC transporter substrate-binding protein [Candidatus Angelobacter sp.]|nr:ABC transporter substrate-binding protein [Candidatus Angelobacter sp.]
MTTEHTGEILWACIFAAALGWPFARLIDPPKPDLKLLVLADDRTPQETIAAFEQARHDLQSQLTIGGAPVEVEIQQLKATEKIETTAKEITAGNSVIMVIAHAGSEAVESVLPVFFGTARKIPVITTVASDDNLLIKCVPGGAIACADSSDFVPLLQLSPTNTEQGRWAIAYATEHHKRKFMIVYDDDGGTNKSYAENLRDAYAKAIDHFNQEGSGPPATIVGPFKIDTSPPTERDFTPNNPDCILYAGGAGNVRRLLDRIPRTSRPLMVILSDSTVQRGITASDLADSIYPINFTYQTDAYDYNHRTNPYSSDSLAIAAEVIGDLNRRGLSLKYRLKSLLGLETATDARRELVRVIKENAIFRTSYEGSPQKGVETVLHPVYTFEGYKRTNGIYHVWELARTTSEEKNEEMKDVDNWHPKRQVLAAKPNTSIEPAGRQHN